MNEWNNHKINSSLICAEHFIQGDKFDSVWGENHSKLKREKAYNIFFRFGFDFYPPHTLNRIVFDGLNALNW